jgi:hypothetical protein
MRWQAGEALIRALGNMSLTRDPNAPKHLSQEQLDAVVCMPPFLLQRKIGKIRDVTLPLFPITIKDAQRTAYT